MDFTNVAAKDNYEIKIEKGPETLRTAKEFSDFLKGLPLSVEDNNELIRLMFLHLEAVVRETFLQGAKLAAEYYESE